jgi:putative ABC transport system permease protein
VLFALAWRNVWRQPYRTALSLCAIALASGIMVFLLALQQGSYDAIKENALRLMDGFAQIQPPGYAGDPDLRKVIAHPNAVMARLTELPAVSAAAPRATSYVILSNGPRSFGAAVYGIDPPREIRVSTLERTIVKGRYLQEGDTGSVVVGDALARNLKLSVGSQLTMLGEASDGSVAADVLTVQGIFATRVTELDRQVVEMPLAQFQSDFAMPDEANLIAVSGRSLSDIQASLPALDRIAMGAGLVVRDWGDLEPGMYDAILLDISISLLFYGSLLIVVVFIILNTLLMSVLERTREFGMLMAIGMRPSRIGRMIWLELLFLSLTGGAIGIVLGSAVTAVFAINGIGFPSAQALFAQWGLPATLYPRLDLTSALAGPLAIALAIAIAGVIPYLHTRKLEPVSAMRAV